MCLVKRRNRIIKAEKTIPHYKLENSAPAPRSAVKVDEMVKNANWLVENDVRTANERVNRIMNDSNRKERKLIGWEWRSNSQWTCEPDYKYLIGCD